MLSLGPGGINQPSKVIKPVHDFRGSALNPDPTQFLHINDEWMIST